MECLIVGIGINVNQNNFSDDYLIKPTSISNELNIEVNINDLKNRIYLDLYNKFKSIGIKDYYEEISKLDYLKDKRVYAQIDNVKELIDVIGIDKDYSLRIIVNGQEKTIDSGEISFH